MPDLRFETLESRRLLAALQVVPQEELGVFVDQGERVVEVSPGQVVGVSVEVTESEEGIAGYQLNFGNSATDLVLRDYFPPFGFGAVSDEIIDSASGDYFVLGATFTLREVPPALAIGGFFVVVPEALGDYRLTSESSDEQASRDTLLVGDNPISITDYGDLVFRVVADLPSVSFAQASATIQESSDVISFDVTLSNTSTVDVRIPLTIGGTASQDSDYNISSSTVVINAGELVQTISILVVDDTDNEPDELITLRLGSPEGATLGATDQIDVTIEDNDEPQLANYAVSTETVSVVEGQGNGTDVSFVVARSGNTSGISTVHYSILGSELNPANSADFLDATLPSGIITFADGELEKSIVIEILGDHTLEADESFQLVISEPSDGGMITADAALVTITNDDTLNENAVVQVPTSLSGVIRAPTREVSEGLLTSVIFTANESGVIRLNETNRPSSFAQSIIVNSNIEVVSQEVSGVVEATVDQDQVYAIIVFSENVSRMINVTEVSGAFTVGADTNFLQVTDTNGDGRTSGLDALIIVNHLASSNGKNDSVFQRPFLNVSQERGVTAIDALLVINELQNNSQSSQESELIPPAEISAEAGLMDKIQWPNDEKMILVNGSGFVANTKLLSRSPLSETSFQDKADQVALAFSTDNLDVVDQVYAKLWNLSLRGFLCDM